MAMTHGAFWLNVVAGNTNPFDLNQLAAYLTNFAVLHCVLIAMAVAECVWMVRRRAWSPWALYGVAAGVAALGVAKWGAGESYFLSAIASLSVLSALWIARFLDSAPPASLRWALGAALFIQAMLLSHAGVSAVLPWLPDRGPQVIGVHPALVAAKHERVKGVAVRPVEQAGPGVEVLGRVAVADRGRRERH